MFDGHGLYLFVSAKGAKVWRMAYRVDGKPKTKSLGDYPLLSLAEARAKCAELVICTPSKGRARRSDTSLIHSRYKIPATPGKVSRTSGIMGHEQS
ncbi:hypothetical protein J2W34_004362 [Variovorax boronicumulans]|nr:hypothetical protein [Variovorax boronicumulans]